MDDSELYTGVDEAPTGVFGNEAKDKETQRVLDEQKAKIRELTPKLQSILDMLDTEMKTTLDFIASYVDNTKDNDENFKAELKAAGRYRKYLVDLKTKFELAIRETKK